MVLSGAGAGIRTGDELGMGGREGGSEGETLRLFKISFQIPNTEVNQPPKRVNYTKPQ